MGKSNKSKRFVQQGVDSVERHSQKIPYRMTYAEAEERNHDGMAEQVENTSIGPL